MVRRCGRHDRHGHSKDVGTGMARADTGRESVACFTGINERDKGKRKEEVSKEKKS